MFKTKIQFIRPIVGIHVRRTDKLIKEAKYHSLDEYMSYVENFYNKIDLMNERNSVNKSVERVVYLATDEPNVWTHEIKPYIKRGYIFKGDINFAKRAQNYTFRTGIDTNRDLMIDLLLLSECDYIVCTLTSHVCQRVVELMQGRAYNNVDLWNAFQSLDSRYVFTPEDVFNGMIAINSHLVVKGYDRNLQIGDRIRIYRGQNAQNSLIINGFNANTNKFVNILSFKTDPFIETSNKTFFN